MSSEKVITSASDGFSLHGVLDLGRVEGILRSFGERIKTQGEEIEELQKNVTECSSTAEVNTIRRGVDRALEVIERRFSSLETRFARLESCQSRVYSAERSVERLNSIVEAKAEQSAVTQCRTELKELFENSNATLQTEMADFESVKRLESGQRQLANELTAVQELVSCKIDRVEVPLLQTAGERVRAADEFRQSASPRIDAVERDLCDAKIAIESKEEKTVIVERLQTIHNELQRRVEVDWAERRLQTPLEELAKRLEVLQCDISLLQPQSIAKTLIEIQSDISAAQRTRENSARKVEALEQMVKSRPNIRLLDKKADRTYAEQLVHEVSLYGQQRYSATDESLDELRNEIIELKKVQNTVDKKLGVSMRFLDWFSSMQLDKNSSSLSRSNF